MNPGPSLREALERPHHLGMIGGDLEEQLAHCASFSFALTEALGDESPEFIADLGTGGGLPGLALATTWVDTAWTLIDVRVNRATEVERAALRLKLAKHVTVLAAPAQDLAHGGLRESFDAVVARAFGPPSTTAECASGLLRVGGVLVVSEPPEQSGSTEDRWPEAELSALGLGPVRPISTGDHRFVTCTKISPLATSLPRRPPRNDRGWL